MDSMSDTTLRHLNLLESHVRRLNPVLGSSSGRKSLHESRQWAEKALNITPTGSDVYPKDDNLDSSIVGLASGRVSLPPSSRRPLPNHSLRVPASTLSDVSVTFAPHELELFNQSLLDKTLSKGVLVSTCDKLYLEFLESFLSHGSTQHVFDVLSDFIQNCTDTLDLLFEERNSKRTVDQDILWLENERNTWRLVYCLYQNRLSTRSKEALDSEESSMMEIGMPDGKLTSENEVVKELYENDCVIRECQLVIDWLEKCSADRKEERGIPEISHFTDKSAAWENTLHQLKHKVDGIAYGASRTIVSKLDPDAPRRENKPLHDLDMEDEVRLVHRIFLEIRCGQLDNAQSLCYHCGQPWRAAVLEGWRLHHDPNYFITNAAQQTDKLPVIGNPNRDVWKVCAWRMSEDLRLPLHERAIQGALCGNLNVLLSTCSTWEDVLWAYLRVQVDIRVEKEIRAQLGFQRHYADMPDKYWQNEKCLEEIFREINVHKDCHNEATKPDHRIQELLISENVGSLLKEMEAWADKCNPHMLRFMAHLVLVLRHLGHNEVAGDNVLLAYVKVLVGMREPRLVAHYVAQLPYDDQIREYAAFLATVVDEGERRICLSVAEEAGLDIETITTRVVEMIRKQGSLNLFASETTASDLEKISALDWVVFYPTQRAEALWQANALMRTFLAVGKLEATSQAFNKIPVDAVSQLVSTFQLDPSGMDINISMGIHQNMPHRIACSVREYLCYKAYLDAQEGFSDWFQHFHHARPNKPQEPSADAPFQEKVAHDHRIAQYERELDHWKKTMQSQTKTVQALLYNVLLFPAGGWLVDSAPSYHYLDQSESDSRESEEEVLRRRQLQELRTICIPKITLLLHTVLHEMGKFAECVQLADLIVSEQYHLYKVYPKDQLSQLLVKIGESSLALLEEKKDPWGIPISS